MQLDHSAHLELGCIGAATAIALSACATGLWLGDAGGGNGGEGQSLHDTAGTPRIDGFTTGSETISEAAGGQVACGAQGEACCNGLDCASGLACANSDVCTAATSDPCGLAGMPCCTGSYCEMGLSCTGGGTCTEAGSSANQACGEAGGACCSTGAPCGGAGDKAQCCNQCTGGPDFECHCADSYKDNGTCQVCCIVCKGGYAKPGPAKVDAGQDCQSVAESWCKAHRSSTASQKSGWRDSCN